ncbi:hypothetical protein P7C70_g1532, partial [Phenoliferia sp. Uapishka_3]
MAPSQLPQLPTLPLPLELTSLLSQHESLSLQIQQHADLHSQLSTLLEARKSGNNQMNLPVDLGRGYMIEGVVKDTTQVFVMGLDDVWVELEIDKAVEFVDKKQDILNRRLQALKEPIAKLRKDYALVTKTLRTALELPDE